MNREDAREVLRNLHSILTMKIPMERKEQIFRNLFKRTEWDVYVSHTPPEAVRAFIGLIEKSMETAVKELGEKGTEADQAGET